MNSFFKKQLLIVLMAAAGTTQMSFASQNTIVRTTELDALGRASGMTVGAWRAYCRQSQLRQQPATQQPAAQPVIFNLVDSGQVVRSTCIDVHEMPNVKKLIELLKEHFAVEEGAELSCIHDGRFFHSGSNEFDLGALAAADRTVHVRYCRAGVVDPLCWTGCGETSQDDDMNTNPKEPLTRYPLCFKSCWNGKVAPVLGQEFFSISELKEYLADEFGADAAGIRVSYRDHELNTSDDFKKIEFPRNGALYCVMDRFIKFDLRCKSFIDAMKAEGVVATNSAVRDYLIITARQKLPWHPHQQSLSHATRDLNLVYRRICDELNLDCGNMLTEEEVGKVRVQGQALTESGELYSGLKPTAQGGGAKNLEKGGFLSEMTKWQKDSLIGLAVQIERMMKYAKELQGEVVAKSDYVSLGNALLDKIAQDLYKEGSLVDYDNLNSSLEARQGFLSKVLHDIKQRNKLELLADSDSDSDE